jgi:hypothetical protein
VVCQYNLPSTTVRVFDGGLSMEYGTDYCRGIKLDGARSEGTTSPPWHGAAWQG